MKQKISDPFLPLAEPIVFLFPNLEKHLLQAYMDTEPVRHLAEAIVVALGTSTMFGVLFGVMAGVSREPLVLDFTVVAAPIAGILGFIIYASYPSIKAKKRVSRLERDLPYALRHLLIEIQAGMNLYEAMVSISDGYGEASLEFRRVVKDINSGSAEIEALEKAVLRNPSLQFRRSLWQMINTLKAGSDLGTTLESLVDAIMEQQVMEVRRYGKELNPYILVYLIGAVIGPSLGVSFLIIFSTFTGGSVSKPMFYMILMGLVGFQIVFIQVIRVKRPKVKT